MSTQRLARGVALLVLAAASVPSAHADYWIPFKQEYTGNSGDHEGAAVAASGGYVYVGVPNATVNGYVQAGLVLVFKSSPNGVKLFDSLMSLNGLQNGAHFGASVAARDGNIVVGGPDYADTSNSFANAGEIDFFFNDGATLFGRNSRTGVANQHLGSAVAITAHFAAASGKVASTDSGCVFTWQLGSGNVWVPFPLGHNVACGSNGEQLGEAVALYEDSPTYFVMAAGAPAATNVNALAGLVHVYVPSGGALAEVGTFGAQSSPAFLDAFGSSVGVDANYFYFGAPGRDNGSGRVGSVSIFSRAGSYLAEYFPEPPATIGGDCGAALNVDSVASGFVLGCPHSDGIVAGEGTARVYRPIQFVGTTVWVESLLSFYDLPHGADALGSSVAIDGNHAFAGAPYASANGGAGNGAFKEFEPDEIFKDGFD